MSWWKKSDSNKLDTLSFKMPQWLVEWERTLPRKLVGDEAAMRVAVSAAALNVEKGTGGPFGAVLVESATGVLLSVGANLVVSARSSVFHAEIVAIMRAQQAAQFHSVGRSGGIAATLYTSAEPCAMCMGAIPWSGIRRVVCGASDADVRVIGFDEGDKPANWIFAYEKRGIQVTVGVLREEASKVLQDYKEHGGEIY